MSLHVEIHGHGPVPMVLLPPVPPDEELVPPVPMLPPEAPGVPAR